MGQKQITVKDLQKNDEKDLQKRSDAASAEIEKILKKYEVALFPIPVFQQIQGQASFVVTTQIRFASVRGQAVEKLAES